MRRFQRNTIALLIVAATLPLATTLAQAQGTFSRWASITPDPRQFATQPGGVLPLIVIGNPTFAAGQYMIYVAASNPDGKTVSRWNSFGPFTLQGNDKWQATLLPGSKLRMERNPATVLSYSSPGPSNAMIYVRNDDRSSWQSICVLPIGGNVKTSCFGGTSNVVYGGAGVGTLSRWTSITPDQRQYAAQPGGVFPLAVVGGVSFVAGQYMVYVGPSNPDGRAIARWNQFGPFNLQGTDKWAAYLLPQSQLRMERNPAAVQLYSSPGPTSAMVYARNNDVSSWQTICVLPTGMSVTPNCFGGSGNVVLDLKGSGGAAATYVGSVMYGYGEKRDMQGSIQLTITGAQVLGALIGKRNLSEGVVTREATFSGQVSNDGRITAAIKGKSHFTRTRKGTIEIEEILHNYPFDGTLQGAVAGDTISGSFRAENTEARKNYMTGTWQATRQPATR